MSDGRHLVVWEFEGEYFRELSLAQTRCYQRKHHMHGPFRKLREVRPDDPSIDNLVASCRELVEAMRDYQMDVDDSPTRKHRDMMDRAVAAIKALEAEGE